jgi:SAM-dependent methyltransferase
VEEGILDLYLPRCRCGGVLRPISEEKGMELSCDTCHDRRVAKDRAKEAQYPKERELYVPRDKSSVEDEWDQASKRYWTLHLAASKTIRDEIFEHVRGGLVLDMGTGPGLWVHYLQQALGPESRFVAADISKPMLDKARQGIVHPAELLGSLDFHLDLPPIRNPEGLLTRSAFVRADAERPPFKDNTFDTCLSFQALQYTNPRTSISQMLRVGKPGARVVVGVQPGSEACGYLEYDCDLSRVKDAKRREGLRRQFESYDRFAAWFEAEYPREAMLFYEGWRTPSEHPLDLYLDKEKGKITEETFLTLIREWEKKASRPLDSTKHSCCYGERRFTKMIRETAISRGAKVLEVGTKTIPLEDARKLDPPRAERIDTEDSWDYGIYLHLYGARYAAIQA